MIGTKLLFFEIRLLQSLSILLIKLNENQPYAQELEFNHKFKLPWLS